jgi:hypothetical protein
MEKQDVADILGLGDKATTEEIISEGTKFCALTWSEALRKYLRNFTFSLLQSI